jgi:hypothetical protein
MDLLLEILAIVPLIYVMTKKNVWPSLVSLPFADLLVIDAAPVVLMSRGLDAV